MRLGVAMILVVTLGHLATNVFYCWLMAAFFLLIIELLIPGTFFCISCSFGSLIAAFFSYYGFPLGVQCFGACGGILLSLWAMKKWYAAKAFAVGEIKTNMYALVGVQALVTKQISHFESGYVKIRGESWKASCDSAVPLAVGSIVRVIRVEGNRVVVTKI